MRNRSRSLFSHPSHKFTVFQNGNLQFAFEEHHSVNPVLLKTPNEITGDILDVTMRIGNTFPELSKYIEEMLFVFPDTGSGKINIQNLYDYYSSLEALLSNYAIYHGKVK